MIDINIQLPPENAYVLCLHNRGTWLDYDDNYGVNFIVAKFKKGLSIIDRKKMIDGIIPDINTPNGLRSGIYRSEDEYGNNKKPYCFKLFGPDTFFGQEITHWGYLPK